MKILVTGGGGFLGRYISEGLLREGHEVISFSRRSYPNLEAEGISCRQGDLCCPQEIFAALEGVEAVFHVAAYVKQWGHWNTYYRTNVVGTQNLIKACKAQGVGRFVFTSSPSVVFGKHALSGVDETIEYPSKYLSHYAHSKALAEKEVLSSNDNRNFLSVSIRPHLVFGPRDPHLIPGVVEAARKNRLVIVGKGDNLVDVTYVENASDAHLQAFKQLRPGSPVCGKAYFIGQERPIALWDFLNRLILPMHNLSPVTRRVPEWLAYGVASGCELGYRLCRAWDTQAPITRFLVKQFAKSHYFSHKAARRDFGYEPKVSIEDGVDRLKQWHQRQTSL